MNKEAMYNYLRTIRQYLIFSFLRFSNVFYVYYRSLLNYVLPIRNVIGIDENKQKNVMIRYLFVRLINLFIKPLVYIRNCVDSTYQLLHITKDDRSYIMENETLYDASEKILQTNEEKKILPISQCLLKSDKKSICLKDFLMKYADCRLDHLIMCNNIDLTDEEKENGKIIITKMNKGKRETYEILYHSQLLLSELC